MSHKLCLLLAALLIEGRALSVEKTPSDTVQDRHLPFPVLGLGVGSMQEKAGISLNLGVWLPDDWRLYGFSLNYCSQIHTSMSYGSGHDQDNMFDMALLVGVRERGEVGWVDFVLGPAYFWETRYNSGRDDRHLSGPGLDAVTSFGLHAAYADVGLCFNYLLGNQTHRLAISLVAEFPLGFQ